MARMYQHHAWSNLVLIDFLSRLSDEQLTLTVPGTYGDSLCTIRHIVVAYVDGPVDDYSFVDFDEEQQASFELTRSMLLCQIIHHATEHRSQIRTTLSAHGITPPEISTWAWRKCADGQAVLNSTPPLTDEVTR